MQINEKINKYLNKPKEYTLEEMEVILTALEVLSEYKVMDKESISKKKEEVQKAMEKGRQAAKNKRIHSDHEKTGKFRDSKMQQSKQMRAYKRHQKRKESGRPDKKPGAGYKPHATLHPSKAQER